MRCAVAKFANNDVFFYCGATQVLCFGCGKKPIESTSYDSEKNMWVVRAYNGVLYGRGKVAGKTAPKLHETNRIRLMWNATSGDVTLSVNGVTDGVIFTGLTEAELFPVVCNYGSVGEATLVSVEHGAAAAGSVAAAGGRIVVSGAGYAPSNGTYVKAPASEDVNGHAKYVKEGDTSRIIRYYEGHWILDQPGPAPYKLAGGPSDHDFATGSGVWQGFQGTLGVAPMPTVVLAVAPPALPPAADSAEAFVAKLASASASDQEAGARGLITLAAKPANRAGIVAAGAVSHLLRLVRSPVAAVQLQVAMACSWICVSNAESKSAMLAAGAPATFFEALKTTLAADNEHRTVEAVKNLIINHDAAKAAVAGIAGFIALFVGFLKSSNETTRIQAAGVIGALAGLASARPALVAAEAVAPLVEMLRGSAGAQQIAADTLGWIACGPVDMRVTIARAGALPLLVELLRASVKPTTQTPAAEAVRLICNGSDDNLEIAVRAGVVPLMVELLKSTDEGVLKQAGNAVKAFAAKESVAAAMATAGAYPSLIALLSSTTAEVKSVGVAAVRALAGVAATHTALGAAGGLTALNARLVAAGSSAVAVAAPAAAAPVAAAAAATTNAAAAGGAGAHVSAIFDPACKSASLTLSDGNTRLKTSSSGRFHAYTTVPLTRAAGGGSWSFLYHKDKMGCVCMRGGAREGESDGLQWTRLRSDEGLTFGFGTKPVSSSDYTSQNAYVVRAYNGSRRRAVAVWVRVMCERRTAHRSQAIFTAPGKPSGRPQSYTRETRECALAWLLQLPPRGCVRRADSTAALSSNGMPPRVRSRSR
jgi:hypothetical protein